MKPWLCFLTVGFVFAATVAVRAADDSANPPQPTASFEALGSQVNGTVTLPHGQCFYGGLRSNMWKGYMYAFATAIDPATPLDTLKFKARASISRWTGKDDKILAVAGGCELLTPTRDPSWKFSLIGSTRAGHRVGTETPEKPRSITLRLVYVPGKIVGQGVPVATWTIAYPGGRPADVITLDLLTSTDPDDLAAKIQTRNESKFVFARLGAHLFD